MPYALRYADGTAQALPGRVALTRQDNDLTKPDTVQAAFSTSFALPDDVATHRRFDQPQVGTSRSDAPYRGLPVVLEAGGVEVMPGARLSLDKHTPRTGYSGRLLGGNRAFYDLLVNADGTDKKLRELDLSAFDHDWTLAAVELSTLRTDYRQGYCYDLYDRGLGAPPLPTAGASKLYEAGYWPTVYARAAWEAIFVGAGVGWRGELPAIFDTALLPATAPFGYADATRAAHQVVAGYAPAAVRQTSSDERDAVVPYTHTLPYKRPRRQLAQFPLPRYEEAVDYTDLVLGAAAVFDPAGHTATITVPGFYDLKAEQQVHLYCNTILPGEVSATLQLFVNGQAVGTDDQVRGDGNLNETLTALAEHQLLQVGDVVHARYKFDKWHGPTDASFELLAVGRLSVQLLSDFPPGGRVHLADWLPDMSCKEYVKGIVQLYGLTQTTDPYTGNVTFERAGATLTNPRQTAFDWTQRIDSSQPAERQWALAGFARRNWFRWKEDGSNVAYKQAVYEMRYGALGWDSESETKAARDFAAGYLDNGMRDVSIDASKDVLTLPFSATIAGAEGLLLLPRWKPKAGVDYQADLQVVADALANGTYTLVEAEAARAKLLTDAFDTQEIGPRLVYRLPSVTRPVLLEDNHGNQTLVNLPLSYFASSSQTEDLDFTRSLLPTYYPQLAAALARPLVLRPYIRCSAAEFMAFTQSRLVWLESEGSLFWVNKLTWENDMPSHEVELIRLDC